MKKYLIGMYLLLLWGTVIAQSAQDELAQLMRDDSVDVTSIAMYPQNVREIIFRVSTHPEGVAKLNDMQKKSNQSFRNLIASYSKEEQNKIWNLTRYTKLMEQLAGTKGKKRKAENVLKNFPADIHDDAYNYAVNHHDLIVAIDKLDKEFDNSFISIVANYSPDDQSAFRRLMNTPEALSLLNRNMHLTVHLGDIYKNNPVLLRQQLDSLSTLVAEQNAREKEEWKKEMQQNPDAQKELKQSAEQYAKDNGYSENDYRDTDPKIIERYVYVSYPYWCGYPWWYEYDYWYPYPHWHHWGFYYWHGDIFWFGPPSWYFLYWHFHHHHYYQHFHDYPHITNSYLNHYYYGPRRSSSGNSAEVHRWMQQNETALPRDFKTNTPLRVERIREFGKSEIDRENFNRANPGKNISRDEFMKPRTEAYPNLKQPVEIPPPLPKSTPEEIKPAEKPAEVPEKNKDKIYIEKPRKTIQSPSEKVQPKPKEVIPRIQPKPPAQVTPQPQPPPQKKEQPKTGKRK
ncbi:MAG TPA: hypothetical protein VI757_05455 [Bacteroidia bacterium]|nr:hypothetical protein [Bacteroidia bacterium]